MCDTPLGVSAPTGGGASRPSVGHHHPPRIGSQWSTRHLGVLHQYKSASLSPGGFELNPGNARCRSRANKGRRGGSVPQDPPVKQDERVPFDQALERARLSAYAPGEFVGQESFMRAAEILSLAVQAGIGPGVSVLDLCCGVAGPGRYITSRLGCTYLGLDSSASAIELGR